MTETGLTRGDLRLTNHAMRGLILIMALGAGGCVNVTAPDKPIEINLNIKVEQQVVVKLDASAKQLIDQNPGVF